MIAIQCWDQPVDIILDGESQRRTITASCYATECLRTSWPAWHGPAYHRALGLCIDEMTGEATPSEARAAFIEAARESHLLARRVR
jgi:hypothetical protein